MLIKIVLALIITEASMIAAKASAHSWGNSHVKERWTRLQLCALVLLSLALNSVLIGLGYVIKNRRGKTWVAMLTNLGYFFGDLVATTALTTLLKLQVSGKIDTLQVFWTPFLLLHLGNSETIAAHFSDEKKLWRRYFLGLIIQFGIACYIFVRFERVTDDALTYIAIPIFIAGFIKCVERLWILRFSGFNQFISSAISGTPPKMSRSQGLGQAEQGEQHHELLDAHLNRKSIIPQARQLHKTYLSFMMFVPLFADIDLIIYKELSDIFSLDESMTAKEAFKMVDAELDFLFDVLYTKTTIFQIQFGFILRFIYFLSSTGALVAFSYANTYQQNHSKLEVSITYLLLLEASFADSIAVVSHLLSNWTMQWLTTPTTWQHLPKFLRFQIAWCLKLTMPMQGQGINFMGQHSFLNYCLTAKVNKFNAAINNNMVATRRILKVFWNIQQHAWVDVNPSWALVDPDLKDVILSRLQQKRKKYQQQGFKFSLLPHLAKKGASDVLKDKGKLFLQTEVQPRLCTATSALLRAHITEPKNGPGIPDVINIHDELQWSINKVESTHSLLLWHIATDILFHYYKRRYLRSNSRNYHQISKKLSDYMMHLLVMRSFMLHSGISKLRYRDTCFEAMELFAREMEIKSKDLTEVATTLLTLDVEARTFLFEEHGQAGKSVFFKGCELAKQLQSFVVNARWDPEELWEMISCVWTEMLFSAAYDCDWKEHAYQLGQGGELLSHVALLMTHLGLNKHLCMTKLPNNRNGYKPPWDWDNLSQMVYYLA